MSDGIAGWFNNIVNYGVSIIWGNNDWLIASNPWYGLLMFVLIGAGLYFTVATRFIQFRHFGHMWQLLRVSNQGRKDGGISSFEALMTSLAARVGTGNLAGVAIAIYLGGPGAVFWMWMTALVGMSTSFIESTLAQAYKVPHNDNVYRGGPAYYIEKGLGKRWLAIFFSLCLLVAFGLAFNGVQSNTIAQATNEAFGVPTWMTGLILVALVAPVVFGGLRSVARIAGKIVPVMAILYILLALYIIITNFSEFPAAVALIVKSAFGFEQAAGGVIGYGIAQAMITVSSVVCFRTKRVWVQRPMPQRRQKAILTIQRCKALCKCSVSLWIRWLSVRQPRRLLYFQVSSIQMSNKKVFN